MIRFSILWRFAIDSEYQRGLLTEERWRDLVAAFEQQDRIRALEAREKALVALVRYAMAYSHRLPTDFKPRAEALLEEKEAP